MCFDAQFSHLIRICLCLYGVSFYDSLRLITPKFVGWACGPVRVACMLLFYIRMYSTLHVLYYTFECSIGVLFLFLDGSQDAGLSCFVGVLLLFLHEGAVRTVPASCRQRDEAAPRSGANVEKYQCPAH